MSKKTADFAEPFEITSKWLAEAEEKEINDPSAMALATSSANGIPSVRMVLLKAIDHKGLVFYTNMGSRKAIELKDNPNAALLFHWKSLRRQIRVEGTVAPVSKDEADQYFSTRARASQIGAWASKQSQVMEGKFEFEAAIAKYTAKFGVGDIPRPAFWSGFRLMPTFFEFWEDKKFRLHDRANYKLSAKKSTWSVEEVYP